MPPPEPAWEAPFLCGFPAAIDGAGTVAAPLLAGFSFTLIGLIVPDHSLRYPGITLSLLVAAGMSYIAAVQCAFWSRQFAITPGNINLWRRDFPPEQKLALQRLHRRGFGIWAARFAFTYRVAIVFLLAGVGMVLVPRTSIGPGRGLAIGIAGLGFTGKVLWIIAGWLLKGFPTATWESKRDLPDSPERYPLWLGSRRLPWGLSSGCCGRQGGRYQLPIVPEEAPAPAAPVSLEAPADAPPSPLRRGHLSERRRAEAGRTNKLYYYSGS